MPGKPTASATISHKHNLFDCWIMSYVLLIRPLGTHGPTGLTVPPVTGDEQLSHVHTRIGMLRHFARMLALA
jgi:hypothetical protein